MNIFKDKRFYTYTFLVCRIILCAAHFSVSLHSKSKLQWLIRLSSDEYDKYDLSLSSVTSNSDTSLVENLAINLDDSKTGGKFPKPHNSFILLSLYTSHYINNKAVHYIIICSSLAFAIMFIRIAIIIYQLIETKRYENIKEKLDKISNLIAVIGLNVLALGQGMFGIFFTNQLCKFETDQPYLFTNGQGNNIFSNFGGCDIYTSVIIASILCWLSSLPDTFIIIANIPKKLKITTICSGLKLILGVSTLFIGILTLNTLNYCLAGAELTNELHSSSSSSLYPKYNLYEYISDTFSNSLSQKAISNINGSSNIGNLIEKSPRSNALSNLHLELETGNQVENIAYALVSVSFFSGILTIITSSAGSSLGYFRSKTLAVFNLCSSYIMSLTHIFTLLSTDYTYTGSCFYCSYDKYFPLSYVLSYEQNRLFDWTCSLKYITITFMAAVGALFVLSVTDMAVLFFLLFKK